MNNAIATTALIITYLATGILHFFGFDFTYTPVEYKESTECLANPYMGFYHIYGYTLADNVVYADAEDVPNLPDPEDTAGERLALIQINLLNYRDRPLTDDALAQLDSILAAWSGTDYSLLLRFIYDWNGTAQNTEPQEIAVILQHMEQTASVYNQYADHIFSLQGLFTGNYGEMNNTKYGSTENMQALAAKLAETADPSVYLAVRTPGQWRRITAAGSYEELAARPDSPYLHRLGLYNDGMLGSDTDTGTYMDGFSREEELAFQDRLCLTVPNGGEVIFDNPYNDLENAVRDMRRMHVSYLNSAYDASVLDKWKSTVYTGSGPFNGISGYDYIRCHMGYRFVLRSSEILRDYDLMQSSLKVTVENVGFSGSYRSFSFRLTVLNTETGETFLFSPETDSSCLSGGETAVFELPLMMETLSPGTYGLYWQTTDDITGEAILYGNDMPLTEHGYLLGTLSVNPAQ